MNIDRWSLRCTPSTIVSYENDPPPVRGLKVALVVELRCNTCQAFTTVNTYESKVPDSVDLEDNWPNHAKWLAEQIYSTTFHPRHHECPHCGTVSGVPKTQREIFLGDVQVFDMVSKMREQYSANSPLRLKRQGYGVTAREVWVSS